MIYGFPSKKMLLIAGPCSLESRDLAMRVAERVAEIGRKYCDCLTVVFKGSFDKANRTSLNSPRGTGIDEGLKIFRQVKEAFSIPVITDVHESWQCGAVGEVCDVIQIPAFLCRQTDLLVSAAHTGRAVNVKKGQFVSPKDMKFVVEKLRQSNASEIWQTERGTTFGYGNLVVDMRSFSIMSENKAPVIFDATHSVQLPSAAEGVSGGERQFVEPLALAAIAAGADGLFIETHSNPGAAMSDAATQLPLENLENIVRKALAVRAAR